jgi:hypothetical protein
MKTKILGLMALVSLVLALSVGAASAVTFAWNTSGPSGSGTFTATYDSGDQYTITDITGTFDGYTITALLTPGVVGNDNLLFYPSTPQLDFNGVAFSASVYVFYIIFNPYIGDYIYEQDLASVNVGSGVVDSFAATPTPLPATLPLFAGGLGFVGYLVKRRKQNAKHAIAAA